LLSYTVRFAREQMRRWRKGGGEPILQGGYDANEVASAVVARVLAGHSRLGPGWTRERLEAELERQVNRELRRLAGRRESTITQSEWEVLPPDQEGEARSVFDEIEGRIANGGEEASLRGDEAQFERRLRDLEERLNGDVVARGVLRCLAAGVCKRCEIAARLRVDVQEITAARKRLERKARGG
jgi:hypothetical protein